MSACPHEVHLDLVHRAIDSCPLMLLWRWIGEGRVCCAPRIAELEVPECENEAIWHVAIPTPDGPGETWLCAVHLPLMLLRGQDGDLIEPSFGEG